MSMNFVTFNQDHSHLAVGMWYHPYCYCLSYGLAHAYSRNHKRISHLHNRALQQMFRDKARRHSLAGDAVFHIVGRSYTFTPKTTNNKHKSTVALLLSPRRLNFYSHKVCPSVCIWPILTCPHNFSDSQRYASSPFQPQSWPYG